LNEDVDSPAAKSRKAMSPAMTRHRSKIAVGTRWAAHYEAKAADLREQVAASRAAMGLPPTVEDQAVLDRVARELTRSAGRTAA